jgi:hypothetical protein
MLDLGLVKEYRGLLYPTPLYYLTDGRADSRLYFNYTLKVEPIY